MTERTKDSDRLHVESAPLGGSALSLAIQNRLVPDSWHTSSPSGVAQWRTHIDRVRQTHADESRFAWMEALHGAFGSAPHTSARARLAEAARDGVVVTTGQQPGLFGGPAYTLTKALSALTLADELSAQLRIPVAPVFWAATDDADWHEAAVTHVVGRNGLERLSLVGPATDGIAMADVPLGDTARLRAALRAASGSVADPLALDLVDAAWHESATVGSSYVTWLRAILEPLGISVLDASHQALREAAHPVLASALQHATDIDSALRERKESIRAAGFAPQVDLVDQLTLVFETVNGVRARVPIEDALARASGAAVGALGANVLLRPVVERAILPTAAYVAGPGELAYFAQVSAVAEACGASMPLAVPRWSANWREPYVNRILERLGVTDESLKAPHVLESRLARAAMDRDVADALERLRVTLHAQTGALADAVSADSSIVPSSVIDGLVRDTSHRIARVERRIVAAVKRREHETAREIAVARAAMYPLGSSPERVLSLVPVLARHGMSVLGTMRALAAGHARSIVSGGAASTA